MAGDSNYADVVLLLHGDGANGSTTITDSSGRHTATANGSAVISTGQSKIGEAALYFNSTGSYNQSNWVSVAGNLTDFAFPGDFTIEFWLYAFSFGASWGSYITDTQSPGWYIRYGYSTTSDKVDFNDGTSTLSSNAAPSTATWTHVAIVRSGSTIKMYIDGTAQTATLTNSGTIPATSFHMGQSWGAAGTTGIAGYLDEFRITKGYARYTSNFTPDTNAFLNYAGQVSGIVKDSAGANAARTVRAYRRDTGALVGTTTSDGTTGAYSLDIPTLDEQTVIALDDQTSGTYYDDLAIRVIPA